jgi:type I restriction enzyme M protein
MSSQASSAGHGEKEVRQEIVETGDVDVMISIRSNFFYTRTVPCELWHFDRAKPPERKDKVLMLDARNVYRKVTRKIYDFSPEQMHNLAAIVWLYRGQKKRFLGLVKDYLSGLRRGAAVRGARAFRDHARRPARAFDARQAVAKHADLGAEKKQALADAVGELREAATLYEADAKSSCEPRRLRPETQGAADRTTPSTRAKAFDHAEAIRARQSGGPAHKLARAWRTSAELAVDDAISAAY